MLGTTQLHSALFVVTHAFLVLLATQIYASDSRPEITTAGLEREAEQIVRDYFGLRKIVSARAADETCKEQITRLVLRIWNARDENRPRDTIGRYTVLYEALTYEYLVRAARDADMKRLYPHFEREIVSNTVPVPMQRG